MWKIGEIILIPKYKICSKIKNKILENKIRNVLKHHDFNALVLEENLKIKMEKLDDINLLNGKYLMKNSLQDVLEYIFNCNNQNTNLENVHIFVNEYTKNNIYIIEGLTQKFKTVNIITENLKYYRRLENTLYKNGILITVSSNKRKAAKSANVIVNLDFDKENFEKYNINMNAIIVNLTNNKMFFERTFKGIIINNYELKVDIDSREFIDEFFGKINEKNYLESCLLTGKDFRGKAEEILKQYKAEIVELIGVRGKIQKSEISGVLKLNNVRNYRVKI